MLALFTFEPFVSFFYVFCFRKISFTAESFACSEYGQDTFHHCLLFVHRIFTFVAFFIFCFQNINNA